MDERKLNGKQVVATQAKVRVLLSLLTCVPVGKAVGDLLDRGQELAWDGCNAGEYSSQGGRIQQVFESIRAKSESNGCSITVNFREKGEPDP